jgi:hypothetical protein
VPETAVVGPPPVDRPEGADPARAVPSTLAKPQKLEKLNVTVAGVLENEQVDYYAVECKKGQRLNVEVEGMRLGQILDTHVTVIDPNTRFEVATNDDNAFARQDAFVSCVAPHDGTFVIQVRESSYQGGPNGHYRMHVGTFPRPRAVFPPAGRPARSRRSGSSATRPGRSSRRSRCRTRPGEVYPLLAEQDGSLAPTANPFRVSPFANAFEGESNDEHAKATRYDGELPVALNGIIEKEGDADFFRFKAKKGQALDINCYARRLRTPLDPVVVLFDDKGKQIAANDDNAGPDSYLRFNAPADGEYVLSVRDHLKHGGPEFVYRVELTDVKPALTLTIPNMGVNFTQDRQWVVVPKGGRFGTTIRATRSEFGGDLALIAKDLPPGVRMSAEPLVQGVDMFAVIFEADKDAAVGGKLVELTAKPADEKVAVAGQFRQLVELAPNGNQAPYYVTTADRVAVAVAEEAPYTLEVRQPKAPLVQSGLIELKVKVDPPERLQGGGERPQPVGAAGHRGDGDHDQAGGGRGRADAERAGERPGREVEDGPARVGRPERGGVGGVEPVRAGGGRPVPDGRHPAGDRHPGREDAGDGQARPEGGVRRPCEDAAARVAERGDDAGQGDHEGRQGGRVRGADDGQDAGRDAQRPALPGDGDEGRGADPAQPRHRRHPAGRRAEEAVDPDRPSKGGKPVAAK